MKTLVLGLGNPILTDDGVGIHVARAAAKQLDRPGVAVAEAALGGLRLLDVVAGYRRLILVDAVRTGALAGRVRRLDLRNLRRSLHAASSHDLDLPTALQLGRLMGMVLPADDDVIVIGIEAWDVTSFGQTCTPLVRAAIPQAVRMVMEAVRSMAGFPETAVSAQAVWR